ncbi:MAG: DUF554 domain-containing protein [Lachnospiraceae bacterium]|nr:DUF554 domain-containing protein [Lachnospiraceae bacterium]
MKGLGTLVNVLAVLAGGGIGLIIKNGLKQRYSDILTQGCGIATIFIGISGALQGMLIVGQDGSISTQKSLLVILSLVIGGLVGELANIEVHIEEMGEKIKRMLHGKSDSRFVDGFVTATLIICIGAMAVVGSIQDGLTGDYSMLFAKALLDFIIEMVLAASMGLGVLFSALPLGIYQGGITLFAALIAEYMTDAMIADLSCIGSVLIFCVGINLTFGKKVRVGNMLPALLIPVIYNLF